MRLLGYVQRSYIYEIVDSIVTKRHAEGVRQTAVGGYNRAIEFTRVIPASHGLSGRQKDYVIVKIEIRLIKNQ